MVCPPGSDQSFGPRVNTSCRSFDFTLQFEDAFLACLPAALFLLLLPPNFFFLLNQPRATSFRSRILPAKLVAFLCISALQVAFLALRAQNKVFQTKVSLPTDVLSLIATGAAFALALVDEKRSPRPSTLISLYLTAFVILNVARIRTLWLLEAGNAVPAVLSAILGLILPTLVLESIDKKGTTENVEKHNYTPETYSGFWARTGFTWLAATFRNGYQRVITLDDLPGLDQKLHSDRLRDEFTRTWLTYDYQKRHSLLRACFRTYYPSFLSAVIPRLCSTAFTFSQPFLINTTVSFIAQPNPDRDYGKGLIGAWAFVYLGMAISGSIYGYQGFRFSTRIRGSLIALIYRQTTRTKASDSGDITAVALMGTDVQRIGQSVAMIHETWASFLDVGIATWLLEQQLSVACLAPVLIALIFIGATAKLSVATKTAQRRWIEKVQERLRHTSAILGDMKGVKMLGLSDVMASIIQGLRMEEIKTSEAYRKLVVVMLLLSNTPINFAPVVTFAVYVVIAKFWKDETLLTAQAFTSIALISLLTTPVLVFIQALPAVLQGVASFDRIQEYYAYAPLPEHDRSLQDAALSNAATKTGSDMELQKVPRASLVSLDGESFSWTKTSPVVLKDLHVEFERGAVTGIVGPVGSGKSALLNAILGEVICTTSNGANTPYPLLLSEPTAYCSQQPWLENTTIRDNIVGVSGYDRKWYATVKNACGLDADMRTLQMGDRTRVGSKGLNLSGGQKQRIALARAVYSKRKTIVLDDVFSGMDAHTVEHVAALLLGPHGLLRGEGMSVVLATHNQKIMTLSDTIIALKDGQIAEIGSPRSLLNKGGYVSKLELAPLPEEGEDGNNKNVQNEDQTRLSLQTTREESILLDESPDLSNEKWRRNGDFSIYKYYVAASGYKVSSVYLVMCVLWTFFTEFSAIWVKLWSEANTEQPNQKLGLYLGIYIALGIGGTLVVCLAAILAFIYMISRSAARLHLDLLNATLKAPFRFFSSTDTGELLNRFSQDMELIDMDLPVTAVNYTTTVTSCLTKIVIIAVFSKYLGVAIPFMLIIVYFLQKFYLKTSRQVRLLMIEAKAPLYTNFTESEAGAATIRAYQWQSEYQHRNLRLIDSSQRPAYIQRCIQNWLGFVLDMIVTILAIALVGTVVTWHDKFSAGSVGVSLVMVVGFNTTLARLIHTWTQLESSIGAVSRVRRFALGTEREEPTGKSSSLQEDWPNAGAIEFVDVVASYGTEAQPVLRSISLSVAPGQHVALCGRSGSGKTSLILSLLRMIDVQEGHITVDGVDVSGPLCDVLRARLNVVPQDPLLLPGTIRFNIDPPETATDKEIQRALEKVNLWQIVAEQGGLDQKMDVSAWSAGQKQLLCLARAIVKQSKVLILDEAMSSVDDDTESLMQDIIDSEFKNCTVLAVMHRLKHVQRYDHVVLLGDGQLLESGRTEDLISSKTRFAELYRSQ